MPGRICLIIVKEFLELCRNIPDFKIIFTKLLVTQCCEKDCAAMMPLSQ